MQLKKKSRAFCPRQDRHEMLIWMKNWKLCVCCGTLTKIDKSHCGPRARCIQPQDYYPGVKQASLINWYKWLRRGTFEDATAAAGWWRWRAITKPPLEHDLQKNECLIYSPSIRKKNSVKSILKNNMSLKWTKTWLFLKE